jgi:hypothetical protein
LVPISGLDSFVGLLQGAYAGVGRFEAVKKRRLSQALGFAKLKEQLNNVDDGRHDASYHLD